MRRGNPQPAPPDIPAHPQAPRAPGPGSGASRPSSRPSPARRRPQPARGPGREADGAQGSPVPGLRKPRIGVSECTVDMITNVNCPPKKTVQKTLALTLPGPRLWLAGPPGSSGLLGAADKAERRERKRGEGGGSRYEVGAGPDPSGDRASRARWGPATALSGQAQQAWRGGSRRAGRRPSVSPPPLQTGLCSREDVSFLSRTLTLHPAAQVFAHFFPEDRSPCRGVHSDDHRAPRRATGRQARPRGAQLPPPRAQQARRKVVGGHLDPRPPPRYLWPVRWSRAAAGAAGPAPVRDHSFQRAARDAPQVATWGGVSRPMERVLLPDGRAGRPIPMSWATPSFHLVLHLSSARAEDMVAALFCFCF